MLKQKELELERERQVKIKQKKAKKEGKDFTPRLSNTQEDVVGRAYKFLLGENRVIREPILPNNTVPDYLIDATTKKVAFVEVKDSARESNTNSTINKYGRCFVQVGGKSANLIIVPFASEVKEARKAVEQRNASMEKEKIDAQKKLDAINAQLAHINSSVLPNGASEDQVNNVLRLMNEYKLKEKKLGKKRVNGLAEKVSREQWIIFSNNNLEARKKELISERIAAEERVRNSIYNKAFVVPAENIRAVSSYFAKNAKDAFAKAEGFSIVDELRSEIRSSDERQRMSSKERSKNFRKNVVRKYKG